MPVLLFCFLFADDPVTRALTYLNQEVPRWRGENGCFSCHNNGDGARALYAARKLKLAVPNDALAATSGWLRKPAAWDEANSGASFKDAKLARIQFAAALVSAIEAGEFTDQSALREAARLVAESQDRDGSWQVDPAAAAASPATYGPAVATWLAKRTLDRAGGYGEPVSRAFAWLSALKPRSVIDASAVLLSGVRSEAALDLLRKAQGSSGGWGPFVNNPPEAFDTALALLALKVSGGDKERIARGRHYLVSTQLATGGWPETTRPPGGQSYAEHISTTAWAALALLATAGTTP